MTEAQEQQALFKVCDSLVWKYPELELLHHIPNGGSRNKAEAMNLKRQGVKPGIPDLFLPVARKGYHGLYIELKRKDGGRLSKVQKAMCLKLKRQGYLVVVCHGAKIALDIILKYMED